MPNIFDQFDQPTAPAPGNVFDMFDAEPAPAVPPAPDWKKGFAGRTGFDPDAAGIASEDEAALVSGVMKTESSYWRNRKPSRTGNVGPMQLGRSAAADTGVDRNDPAANVRGGAAYLRRMQKMFGNEDDALMAYNWGPGNVRRWIRRGRDPAKLPAETRDYLGKVKAERDRLVQKGGAGYAPVPAPVPMVNEARPGLLAAGRAKDVLEKTGRNVYGGVRRGSAGLYNLSANAVMLLRKMDDALSPDTAPGAAAAAGTAENWLRKMAARVEPGKDEIDDDTISKIYQIVGQLPADLMKYASGGAALGGPVLGFGVLGAMEAADRGPMEAFIAAVEGLTLGKVLKGTETLTRPAGAATVGTFAGGQAAIAGADPEDIGLSAATMGLLRAGGGRGRVDFREAGRNVFDQFDRKGAPSELTLGGAGAEPTPGVVTEGAKTKFKQKRDASQAEAKILEATELIAAEMAPRLQLAITSASEGGSYYLTKGMGSPALVRISQHRPGLQIRRANPNVILVQTTNKSRQTWADLKVAPDALQDPKRVVGLETRIRELAQQRGLKLPEPARVEPPPPPAVSGKTERVHTPGGEPVDYRFEVVDADTLVASHDATGKANPAFPQEFQPRERSRKASQEQIAKIANNLIPEMLGRSETTAGGAPFVGPDNVVESGNARVLAVRRARALGAAGAERYDEWLQSQGYDTAGVKNPVLIRRRVTDLTPEERVSFTRMSNVGSTQVMSATERGVADAKALPAAVLDQYRGGDIGSAENARFVREFVGKVIPGPEQAAAMTKDGGLSTEGRSRIENALFSKAYDNPDLLSALRESTEERIRTIGSALVNVAPKWSQLRDAVAAGKVPAELDITADLQDAVRVLRKARSEGQPVPDIIAQGDFVGGDVSPETMGILRLMFRDPQMRRARAWKKTADGLARYVDEAMKTGEGPGLSPDQAKARATDLLADAKGRVEGGGDKLQAAPESRGFKSIKAVLENPENREDISRALAKRAREHPDWRRLETNDEALAQLRADMEQQAKIPSTEAKMNTPERRQLQRDVADKLFERNGFAEPGPGLLPPAAERRVVVVLGSPAAGKSTIIKQIMKDRGYILNDADEAKLLLKENHGGLGAPAVHQESARISEGRLLEKSLASDLNIVMALVGKNTGKISTLIENFKERGYHVTVVDVSLPTKQTLLRSLTRYLETGRLLPPDYVLSVAERHEKTYLAVKGKADDYAKISTDTPFGGPAIVLENSRGYDVKGILGRGRAARRGGQDVPAPSTKRPPTEKTDQGDQIIGLGVKPVTDRARLDVAARKPLKSQKRQKAPDEGLFDVAGRGQLDLVELSRAAGKKEKPPFPGAPSKEAPLFPGGMSVMDAGALKAEKVMSGRQRFWNRVEGKYLGFYGALGKLPAQKRYLAKRYLALGNMARIDEIGKRIYDVFRRGSEADREAIYEYLTTKGADVDRISDRRLQAAATRVKQMIDRVGRKLVARGLLDAETQEAHRGEYLPRAYLKYLLPEGVGRGAGAAGPRTSDLGYRKARKQIPKEVRELILGEITDPGFLASRGYIQQSRDVAVLDFLEEVSKERAWVFPENMVEFDGGKVTAQHLMAEARRIRGTIKSYKPELRRRALEKVRAMEDAAQPVLDAAPEDPAMFRQVPDTPRYGSLRGMWVRKEIHNDVVGGMNSMPPGASLAERILGQGGFFSKVTQLWKLSKVALNPPTQIRNFVSNGILLDLSGVPFHRLPDLYVRALDEMIRGGKHWKIAKKYGVSKTTFASQEMYRMREDLIRLDKGVHPVRWLREAGAIVANRASDVYGLSEAWGKTVKIMDAMKREGMSAEDAALAAHKALFDYSLAPSSVRYLRSAPIGIPFLTFYYKVLPRLLETAVVRPSKYIKYALIGPVLSAWIANDYDVDNDDVKALLEALPTWLRERGNAYVLPYKDEAGRWQAIDIGYFFPWSMYQEIGGELASGRMSRALQTSGAVGSPLAQLIAAASTNKDPFTEREIARSGDPPARQVADIMKYLWRMSAPTWLTDIGAANRLRQAISKDVDRYGEPRTTVPQALGRFVGVNVYPLDPERSRATNLRRMKRDIGETKRQRKYAVGRQQNLTREERRAIIEEYNDYIAQQQKEMGGYAKRSRVHPNLR